MRSVCGGFIPFLIAVTAWSSPLVAAPCVVRFEADTPQGWLVAERCSAIWQDEGSRLTAELLPAGAAVDTVLCLVANTAVFRRAFGGGVPDWGVGAAAASGRLVALDLTRLPTAGRGVREIFLHEMVHALLFQGSQGRWLPTWLHEGVAMHYGGEWRFTDTVSLLMEGRVPDLARLQGPFPGYAHRADRAYRTSLLAFDRLQNRYGERVIPDLLSAVVATDDFSAAFKRVTGVTDAVFYRDFAHAMRWRFGWLVLMTRWPGLFVLLSLVLLVGGCRKVWLARRRLAAMDDDETGG